MQLTEETFPFAGVCRSQQKAAGRASSSVHQPATIADSPRASAPVPPTTQPGVPEPAPHRPSAPDSLNPAEPNAGLSLRSTSADMQQLQSNLMRPATPPSARMRAQAADQADLQGGSSTNHSQLLRHPSTDFVCPQVLSSGSLLCISSSLLHCFQVLSASCLCHTCCLCHHPSTMLM